MRKLPQHGACFVCGEQNTNNMGVTWYVDNKGTVTTETTLTEAHQGPPKLAHGGASAALLDEAMGAAVWQAGHKAAAVNLNVRYHCPVPLGVKIKVDGWVMRSNGKTIFTQGAIRLPDGALAVSSKGVYVEAEHLFTDLLKEMKMETD
jgi:uncharacterized protein (TIGR00369 family)